jgi:hypothetical protein
MGLIASWLEEAKPNMMAQSTVDETSKVVLIREDMLGPYVPIRYLTDFKELAYMIKQSSPIAALVGRGQEIPTISQGELRKLAYSLFKIGLAIPYDEQNQIDMKEALELAALRRIEVYNEPMPNGAIVQGAAQGLAKILFGNYEVITKGLFDLTKFLTYQVLQYGHVSGYTSPLTGVSQAIDYRDPSADWGHQPQGRLAHFPPSLAGTSKAWNQPETSTPLEDLQEWNDVYSDSNDGKGPDAVMWSKFLTRDILKSRSVLRKFSTINMQGVIIGGVDMADKNMLRRKMEDLELPKFIENDEQFTESYFVIENGAQKRKERKIRFHHSRRVTFLQEKMGEQLIGPTVEGDFTPGFDVITYEKQKRPVRDQTEGVGNILPVFMTPAKIWSREVRDAA